MKSYLMKLKSTLFYLVLFCIIGTVQAQNTKLSKVADLPQNIDESSGLTWASNKLFTINDGKKPVIYVLDTADAKILQTIQVKGVEVTDLEDLTTDGTFIYIGDIGNNKGDRTDLKILRVKLSDIGNEAQQTVNADVIRFHYVDQVSFVSDKGANEFDCEAMVAMGDSLYLFTKRRTDGKTSVYALPKSPGDHVARYISTIDVKGRITAASVNDKKDRLVLLGYQKSHQFPFIWVFPFDDRSGIQPAKGKFAKLTEETVNWQTEGITFINGDTFFVSSETSKELPGRLYKGRLSKLTDKK